MFALLQKIYCICIAYPPIDAVIIVSKNFCQSRSPTAASDNAKLHSNHFDEQQIYKLMIACISMFYFMSPASLLL
jgi:hypothetical protein